MMPVANSGAKMTGTLVTRVLGVSALAATGLMAVLGLVISPPDVVQGEAVRMLYIHVPSIWIAYGGFALTSISSILFLRRSRRRPDQGRHYDRLAGSAAEVGVVFTAITLITGMLWGKVTWGTYWQWDARLTTTVLLFVTYLGYLALRRLPAEPAVRSRRAAVMALITLLLTLLHVNQLTVFGDGLGPQTYAIWMSSIAISSMMLVQFMPALGFDAAPRPEIWWMKMTLLYAPIIMSMFTPYAVLLIPAIWVVLPLSSVASWLIEKDVASPSYSFVLYPLLAATLAA